MAKVHSQDIDIPVTQVDLVNTRGGISRDQCGVNCVARVLLATTVPANCTRTWLTVVGSHESSLFEDSGFSRRQGIGSGNVSNVT